MGKYEDLENLDKLRKNGTITDSEFEIQKIKILNGEQFSKNKNGKIVGIIIVTIIAVILVIGIIVMIRIRNNDIGTDLSANDNIYTKEGLNNDSTADYNNSEEVIVNGIKTEEIYTDETENNDNETRNSNKVNTDMIKDSSTSKSNFIQEIYNKYPNLAEGFICSDGNNYWLLDANGKKVYFYDLDSFETAKNNLKGNTEASKSNTGTKTTNSKTTTVDNSNKYYMNFVEGFQLDEYTSVLKEEGIKYVIEKVNDLKYDDNIVISVKPNGTYIDRNETVKITVTENTYDMDVTVDTIYLLNLAEIELDSLQGKEQVELILKINGNIVYNGGVDIVNINNAKPLEGVKIRGKRSDVYNVEAAIEGVKINKKIKTYYAGSEFVIYGGGPIGGG